MVPGHELVDTAVGQPLARRSRVSFSQAKGSTPFIFAVCSRRGDGASSPPAVRAGEQSFFLVMH